MNDDNINVNNPDCTIKVEVSTCTSSISKSLRLKVTRKASTKTQVSPLVVTLTKEILISLFDSVHNYNILILVYYINSSFNSVLARSRKLE